MLRRLKPDTLDQPVTQYCRVDFLTLRAEQTVAEALDYLRTQSLEEEVVYLYVLDTDRKLVGVVPTRRLLASPPDRRIADIMQTRVISLPHTAPVLLACEVFLMHRFLALPIVDDAGRMVCVADIKLFTDEVFGLAEHRELSDIFQFIGVKVAQARGPSSALSDFRGRFPWLLCNIVGGVLCAVLSARYEHLLGSVLLLAMFVPVVLALAESVSMQSVTITLQTLHGPRIDWRSFVQAMSREFVAAVLLGVCSGALVMAAAWVWRRESVAALAIGASICLSMITACLLGLALPWAVRLLGRDPKIAAGPIVLAIADLLTLLFYFNLAGWMLA